MLINEVNGQVSLVISADYTSEFKITACAAGKTDELNCVTSDTITLAVAVIKPNVTLPDENYKNLVVP